MLFAPPYAPWRYSSTAVQAGFVGSWDSGWSVATLPLGGIGNLGGVKPSTMQRVDLT